MYDELASLIEQLLAAETDEAKAQVLALVDLPATEAALTDAARALLASEEPGALDLAAQAADALDIVRAVRASRQAASAADAETIARVRARVEAATTAAVDEGSAAEATDGPEDEEAAGDDAAAEDEAAAGDDDAGDTAEAAATPAPVEPPRPALSAVRDAAPADAAPQAGDALGGVRVTAAADVPGVSIGSDFADLRTVADAIIRRQDMLGKGRSGNIEMERLPVVQFNYLDTLRQAGDDKMMNALMLREAGQPDAMTASGGFCAPAEVVYSFVKVNTPTDLVQNWLPVVGAPRGSIEYPVSPDIRDAFNDNVTRSYSNQDDINGTHKITAVIACPTFNTCTVGAQYVILQFGNFGTRAYPEWVEHWLGLSMDTHAHKVSQKLIIQMVSLSNAAVAVGPNGGATGTLFGNFAMAAADLRHDLRMGRDALLEIVVPAWTYDLIRSDLARARKGTLETLSVSNAEINTWFAASNLVPRLVEDWQDISGNAATGTSVWPSGLDFLLYPPGTFVKLDMGTLDLGVVRDSVLNATNDYNIFVESFESVCKPGIESRLYSVSICANGSFSADQNLSCAGIDIPGS